MMFYISIHVLSIIPNKNETLLLLTFGLHGKANRISARDLAGRREADPSNYQGRIMLILHNTQYQVSIPST
jgi:hypothetical protein